MLALLRRDIPRAAVLLAVVGVVALTDGLARGLTMPPDKVSTSLPTLTPRPSPTGPVAIADLPVAEKLPPPVDQPAPTPEPTPAPVAPEPGRTPAPAPPTPTPAGVSAPDGAAGGISPQQLHEAIQTGGLVVFDARSREEYVAGHLPLAFSLPMDAFSSGTPAVLQMFPTSHAIVVYCGGGDCHASHNVASMLQSLGYTNVAVFEGGFAAWSQAGLPTETGEPPL